MTRYNRRKLQAMVRKSHIAGKKLRYDSMSNLVLLTSGSKTCSNRSRPHRRGTGSIVLTRSLFV